MYLWQKQDEWSRTPIDTAVTIVRDREGRVMCGAGAKGDRLLATVIPCIESGECRAVLVTAAYATVLVNGYRPLDVATLDDRDEIQIDAARLLFAAFRPAAPEPRPGGVGEVRCARCARPVLETQRVVRCPACAGIHHADAPRCWEYDVECGACRRVRATLTWSPAEEEAADAAG